MSLGGAGPKRGAIQLRHRLTQWFKQHSDSYAEEEDQDAFFEEELWGPVCSRMVRAIHKYTPMLAKDVNKRCQTQDGLNVGQIE